MPQGPCCVLLLGWKEILGAGVGVLSRLIEVPATLAAEVSLIPEVILALGSCLGLGLLLL